MNIFYSRCEQRFSSFANCSLLMCIHHNDQVAHFQRAER
jgi:hypothetical protein